MRCHLRNGRCELWVDINGDVVPAKDATVSVWDRGFLFGDAVFEAIRIHRGKLVLWGVHYLRLLASARGIGIDGIPDEKEILRRIKNLLSKSNLEMGTIYIQITRGNIGYRSDFEMPAQPTVFIAVDHHTCLPEEKYENGVSVITFEDIRWKYSHIKSTNLLPRTLARIEANKLGAHEAIFRSKDGYCYEGTSTNLFVLREGRLFTPPLSDRLLAGATRGALLPLAKRIVKEVKEEDITVSDLLSANEVMLVGTTTEVLGVIRVDGQQIGDGKVGRIAKELRRLYHEEVLNKQ